MKDHSGSGALYGLGVIGAIIYYIQTATSFVDGLIGFVLAFFWPAVVVYKVFELLKV